MEAIPAVQAVPAQIKSLLSLLIVLSGRRCRFDGLSFQLWRHWRRMPLYLKVQAVVPARDVAKDKVDAVGNKARDAVEDAGPVRVRIGEV